ncbi:MAG: endonuclease [Ignavibacteriales bacterium]|nr:endonuclease [Ignavibacteriales bacterium]
MVTIYISDDGITEGNETLTFELQNVSGGNSASVGATSQFNLTIIEGYSGNYYAPITLGAAGDQLHFELHNLIKGHLEYPYSSSGTDVWDILMDADEDPENSANVILIYTGRSQVKTFNASTSTSDDAWNREHVWAKSRGDFGTDPAAGTDAHHLKASDASVNSTRSNKDFDDGGTQVSDGGVPIDCYTDEDSWEPRDEVKGDVARMLFYMDVRYDGERTDPELHLVDYTATATGEPVIGKLSTLLTWNAEDPPDAFEIRRNNIVYGYQFNRNPFIDHPEWVDLIWGASAPNSPIIANVDRNVKIPDHDQNIVVTADISDDGFISKAEIKYSVDNGSLITIPMSVSGGGSALYKGNMATASNSYSATIPESVYENGSYLSYYIYTEDNEGNPKYGTIQQLFTGVTDISKLHSVKEDGRLEYDGILAKINGVATVGTPTFSESSLDVYLQDETGGISIYKAGDATAGIILGHSYTITGNLDLFNGKTELIPEVSSADIVDNGAATLPQPFEMTLAQLLTNAETMEGRLVLIHNLSLISGTWAQGQSVVLSDDGGTTQITLHYDSSTDLGLAPTWPKDITGIYSQYDQIYPYVNDYQILPRYVSDVTNSVSVELTIFLEGNYNSATGEMLTGLNTIIPKTSPYSEDPRTVLSIPQDIVDWVLVELRETLNGPAVSSHSALLHKDGRIVADDGISSTIRLTGDSKQYYIVVKHRNHLPIISKDPVTLNTN